jgi:hypothetical protein
VVAELEVVESGVAGLWKRVGALDGGEEANELEVDSGMLIYALCQLEVEILSEVVISRAGFLTNLKVLRCPWRRARNSAMPRPSRVCAPLETVGQISSAPFPLPNF